MKSVVRWSMCSLCLFYSMAGGVNGEETGLHVDIDAQRRPGVLRHRNHM